MKDPHKMTHPELVEYVNHLKSMIGNLQGQLTKALAAVADAHRKLKKEDAA